MDSGVFRTPGAPESLPENFRNLFQRQIMMRWTQIRLDDPNATEDQADELAIDWMTGGYAEAYAALYEEELARGGLVASDVENADKIQEWALRLERMVPPQEKAA